MAVKEMQVFGHSLNHGFAWSFMCQTETSLAGWNGGKGYHNCSVENRKRKYWDIEVSV